MNPLCLTECELYEITARVRPSAQARWLRRNGIPFIIRGDGHLRVIRANVEHIPTKTPSEKPNFDALRQTG